MNTPQAKTGVEVERLPELPAFSPLIGHMLRDYVPASVELQVAVAIREYAKAYATASLTAERAEAVRMRKMLETVQATLPHMGGVLRTTYSLMKDIEAALSPSQQGEPK